MPCQRLIPILDPFPTLLSLLTSLLITPRRKLNHLMSPFRDKCVLRSTLFTNRFLAWAGSTNTYMYMYMATCK